MDDDATTASSTRPHEPSSSPDLGSLLLKWAVLIGAVYLFLSWLGQRAREYNSETEQQNSGRTMRNVTQREETTSQSRKGKDKDKEASAKASSKPKTTSKPESKSTSASASVSASADASANASAATSSSTATSTGSQSLSAAGITKRNTLKMSQRMKQEELEQGRLRAIQARQAALDAAAQKEIEEAERRRAEEQARVAQIRKEAEEKLRQEKLEKQRQEQAAKERAALLEKQREEERQRREEATKRAREERARNWLQGSTRTRITAKCVTNDIGKVLLDGLTVADTIASLKRAIADKMDVPPERQTLIVNGRPLVDDAAALVDYLFSSSAAAATEEITVLVLVK